MEHNIITLQTALEERERLLAIARARIQELDALCSEHSRQLAWWPIQLKNERAAWEAEQRWLNAEIAALRARLAAIYAENARLRRQNRLLWLVLGGVGVIAAGVGGYAAFRHKG